MFSLNFKKRLFDDEDEDDNGDGDDERIDEYE